MGWGGHTHVFIPNKFTIVQSMIAKWYKKTPDGWPGENGSRRGSAGCCGTKCTLRAAAAPGGGTAAGGRPLTLAAQWGRCRRVCPGSQIIFPRAWKQFFGLKITSILWCGSGIRNLFEPGSGLEKFGSGINIPDPQHCFFCAALAFLE